MAKNKASNIQKIPSFGTNSPSVKLDYCSACGEEKTVANNFYKSNNPAHKGHTLICKNCVRRRIYRDDNKIDKAEMKKILKEMDLPWFEATYQKALDSDSETFGVYIRLLNTVAKSKGKKFLVWEDGETEEKENKEQMNKNQIGDIPIDKEELKNLIDKYGYGYPDEEYFLFEKKYQQLRPSIQLLTTMHDEFFREYCVDKVKETLAKAKGDFKEAKEWASMAKDASTAGKLNPSQMSKADLSGGLDTFGQLNRTIEQTSKGELLNILPKYIEKPKDKVDIVLWLHVNAIRDIKGLPPCEYKDIYKFYEERRQSYESQMLDNDLENIEGEE